MKKGLTLLMGGCLLLLFAGRSQAQDKAARCEAYARTAVTQSTTNEERGCGFEGPRWSNDLQGHRAWCLLVNDAQAREEQRARETALQQECRAPEVDKAAVCEAYASAAVTQNATNEQRGCGFEGPRWSNDYQGHRNWCLLVDAAQVQVEQQARETALQNECAVPSEDQGAAEKAAFCNDYARTAIEQHEANEQRSCGFEGARWSNDYQGHQGWCLQVDRRQAEEEEQARRSALQDQCVSRKTIPPVVDVFDTPFTTIEPVEAHPSWNRPDLAAVRVETQPAYPQPNQPVRTEAVIINRGTGEAPPARLRWRVRDQEKGEVQVPLLAPAETTTVSIAWTPSETGRYVVQAELLFEGGGYDGRFDNNSASEVVQVGGSPVLDHSATMVDLAQVRAAQEATLPPGEHLIDVGTGPAQADPAQAVRSTWHFVIPGDGGPETAFSGASSRDQWFSVGPTRLQNGASGRMDQLVVHPKNPRILYASASKSGSGGIWRSTDAGASWEPLIHHDLPCLMIGALTIDPRYPQVLYAGTGASADPRGCGLFKSIDGGKTWHRFADVTVARGYSALEVAYLSGGDFVLYAGTEKGVLRYTSLYPLNTSSSSSEWTRVKSGNVMELRVNPRNPDLVYASILGQGLYRTEGGVRRVGEAHWERLTKGLPMISSPKQTLRIDLWSGNPDIMYASIAHPLGLDRTGIEQNLPKLGIYRSADRGTTWAWKFWGDNTERNLYNPFVRVSPTDPDLVYFGGVWLYKKEASRSRPSVRITNIHDDMHGMTFNPAEPGSFYILGDGGIYRCRLASPGACVHRNNGLATLLIYDVDTSTQRSDLVIAGTQDNGTVMGEGQPIWREIRGGDGFYSLIGPNDDNVMYTQYQALTDTRRTTNPRAQRVSWHDAHEGLPKRGMGSGYLTIHPHNKDYLVTAGDPVYFSTNGGKKWTTRGPKGSKLLSQGIPYKGSVSRLVIQPNTGTWVAGTTSGQVWFSKDEGKSWQFMFMHGEAARVVSMAFAPTDPTVLLVAFRGGVSPWKRIFRAVEDPSATSFPYWQALPVAAGFPQNRMIQVISGDGWDAKKLYVGTDLGVFQGTLNGQAWTWQPYNDRLPLADVRDLVINRKSRQLLAATYGRGLWAVETK